MIIIGQYKNCYLVKTNSNDDKCYLVDMNLNASLGYDYPEKFMRYYRFEDYKRRKTNRLVIRRRKKRICDRAVILSKAYKYFFKKYVIFIRWLVEIASMFFCKMFIFW